MWRLGGHRCCAQKAGTCKFQSQFHFWSRIAQNRWPALPGAPSHLGKVESCSGQSRGDADSSLQGQNSASQTLGRGDKRRYSQDVVWVRFSSVTPTPPHPPPPTYRADRPGGKARPRPGGCPGVSALPGQWQRHRRGDRGEALQEETQQKCPGRGWQSWSPGGLDPPLMPFLAHVSHRLISLRCFPTLQAEMRVTSLEREGRGGRDSGRSSENRTRPGSGSDCNMGVLPSTPKPWQSARASYPLQDHFLKCSSRKIPSLSIIVVRTQ